MEHIPNYWPFVRVIDGFRSKTTIVVELWRFLCFKVKQALEKNMELLVTAHENVIWKCVENVIFCMIWIASSYISLFLFKSNKRANCHNCHYEQCRWTTHLIFELNNFIMCGCFILIDHTSRNSTVAIFPYAPQANFKYHCSILMFTIHLRGVQILFPSPSIDIWRVCFPVSSINYSLWPGQYITVDHGDSSRNGRDWWLCTWNHMRVYFALLSSHLLCH